MIAFRSVTSVTTAGSGSASTSVAQLGVINEMYVNPLVRFAVPPGVVTDTVVAPAVAAGVTAVTVVELTTLTEVAATPSIVTELVPVKFVPVIVIVVPPESGPVFGLTDEIVGGSETCAVYAFASVPTPNGVVTTTEYSPAASAGAVAVIVVAFTTDKLCVATPPIVTPVAPVNPVPVIVIAAPPLVTPALGLMPLIVGPAT